jgi:hypothetical protein
MLMPHHPLRRDSVAPEYLDCRLTAANPGLQTVEPVITENEMVEQPDAQQVSSFAQSCGERHPLGSA